MSSFTPAIPEISPSLRWAQSASNIMMEVKFATRFDSPACLDIFDLEVSLEEGIVDSESKSSEVSNLSTTGLHISAMCRNDKKLLKYRLDLQLFDDVLGFEIDQQMVLEYE